MKLILSLALIFIASCKISPFSSNRLTLEQFNASLYQIGLGTFHIKTDQRFKDHEVELSSPPNTWMTLGEVHYLKDSSFQKEVVCLLYRIPLVNSTSDTKGILKIVSKEKEKTCEDYYFKEGSYILPSILKLSFQYLPPKIPESGKSFIILKGLIRQDRHRENKDFLFKIPLMNISSSLKDKVMKLHQVNKRFSSNETLRHIPSVMTLPVESIHSPANDFSPEKDDPHLFGLLSKHTLVRCHDVNDKCETTLEYTCDQCRYGWFEGIGANCPQGGPKFCGISHCGQKGEPACPRGSVFTGKKIKVYCQEGSNAGYCERGLTTECDDRNVLICL